MYDLIILGTGPAGLSAAVYAARYKMNFLVIGAISGGTITQAHQVENYPGIEGVTGIELGKRMEDHAKKLGSEIVADSIKKIEKKEGHFILHGSKEYEAKRILLAMGADRTKLNIKGEDEFLGKGVSYCATCDGPFFKDKTVCVVGGGNAAVTSALYMAELCKKVYLIYRGEELKAEPAWVEKLKAQKNIESVYSANITEIQGENRVEKVVLDTGRIIGLDGVFIEIGSTPNKALIADLNLHTDNRGYVTVDSELKTGSKGIWAAGDITQNGFKLRQVITAAAEGAIAIYSIYLDTKKQN